MGEEGGRGRIFILEIPKSKMPATQRWCGNVWLNTKKGHGVANGRGNGIKINKIKMPKGVKCLGGVRRN